MTDIRAALGLSVFTLAGFAQHRTWCPEATGPADCTCGLYRLLDAIRCTCGHKVSVHTTRDVSDAVGWPCNECRSDRCHAFILAALAAASPEPVLSRSVQRRQAIQRGGEMPTFDASQEPERLPGGMKRDHEGRLMPGWGDPEPAPAAPTVEALRDALLSEYADDQHAADLLLDRLIELEAAARADERTRLAGETPSRIHLLGMLASMEWVQPTSNSSPSCPWCGSQKHFGHGQGCSLATAIAGQEP